MKNAKTEEKQGKTTENGAKTEEKQQKLIEYKKNSLNKNEDTDTSKLIQFRTIKNGNTKSIDHIKKKVQYNQLIKLVKDGRYVSARLTAKALKVDFMTVLSWMKTAKAQQASIEAIDHYVKNIEHYGRKDWKAHDRLLNYAVKGMDEDKGDGGTNNIINVYNQTGKVAVQVNS